MNCGGLIVVEGPRHFSKPNAFLRERFNPGELKERAKAAAKYQGIEGEIWPDEPEWPEEDDDAIFLPFDRVELAIKCFHASPNGQRRLLAVGKGALPVWLPDSFEFIGYDVGNLDSRYNRYSCVFNEILFGSHAGLRAKGALLNGHGLFSDASDASAYVEARKHIRGLEDFEHGEPDIIAIWRYSEHGGSP